jgi:thioredoxin 1
MRDVTDETFESDVLKAGKPVVVDFWAPWCGPCKAVTPVLEQLAEASAKVEFVKVDIDENPVVASRYDVLSIPTVILFDGGEARETLVGARPRAQYERAFAEYL